MDNVIVSKNSASSIDPYDIIDSNISFINLLKEEGFTGVLCVDAETSYYIDYYHSQVKNGGFSQFVYNSGWNEELNELIRSGLEKMNAKEHLAFFNQQVVIVENHDELALAQFLDGDYFGKNPTRQALDNDDFLKITENLIELNCHWLKKLPNLLVLTIEEMFTAAEQLLGKELKRD